MSLKLRFYIIVVCLSSVAILLLAPMSLEIQENLVALLLLILASFLTQIYELEILPKWYFSTNVAVATTAVFVGGLPLGIWVMLLSTLPAEVLLRWDHLESGFGKFLAPVLFNTAQVVLSVAAAAATFRLLGGGLAPSPVTYYSMGASFLAYIATNNLLLTAIIALETGDPFSRILRSGLRNFHWQFITMAVLAVLMTTLYQVSPAHLALAFVPLILVYYATSNYLRLRRESDLAFRQITELLAERDEYTGSHSVDVEKLAIKLAYKARLRDDQVEAIKAGAAIHDIGKIAIPDAILKKLGPLTDAEFQVMKTHTIIGAQIIGNLGIYREVVPIVRHEHEHWDGSGYPDGLTGEAIPIGARIVAVADVYSALTTERAYRPPQGKPLSYSHREACAILSDMAGTVLDPQLVPLFVDMLDSMAPAELAEATN